MGCTSNRWMARFRWRAPYFMSVPSRSMKSACGIAGFEDERAVRRGVEDSLLHHVQLDVENLTQFLGSQRAEGYDAIQPVHELGREFSARGVDAAAAEFPVEFFIGRRTLSLARLFQSIEPELGSEQSAHFRGSQITGHEDHGAGEIHFAVVAESQSALVEDSEQ